MLTALQYAALRYFLLVLLSVTNLAVLLTSPWRQDNAPCARALDQTGREVVKVCTCSQVLLQYAYTLMVVEMFMLLFSASYDVRQQKYTSTYRFSAFLFVFYAPLVIFTFAMALVSDVECGEPLWTWTIVAFAPRILTIVVLVRDHVMGRAASDKETPDGGRELFQRIKQPNSP